MFCPQVEDLLPAVLVLVRRRGWKIFVMEGLALGTCLDGLHELMGGVDVDCGGFGFWFGASFGGALFFLFGRGKTIYRSGESGFVGGHDGGTIKTEEGKNSGFHYPLSKIWTRGEI